jgi:hypothetical protein
MIITEVHVCYFVELTYKNVSVSFKVKFSFSPYRQAPMTESEFAMREQYLLNKRSYS